MSPQPLASIEGIDLPNIDEMVEEILQVVTSSPTFLDTSSDDWKIVHQELKPVPITVYRSNSMQERFKTLIEMDFELEEIVDFCTNVLVSISCLNYVC